MKILITGGAGVNGTATARFVVAQGLRPVLLDSRKDFSLIRDIEKKVDFVEADVVDGAALEKTVAKYGITHIAHLAALMPEPTEADPRLGVRIGVEGMVNVLEVARAHKIRRVVYTSSKGAYGAITGEHSAPRWVPVREDYPRNPRGLYGVIKVCCEEISDYYRRRYGVECVSLRFSSICGPAKEARHGIYSLYGQLIEKAMAGEDVILPEEGDVPNDVVYVGDVARSIWLALRAEGLRQWVFNVGLGRGITLREFAEVLKRLYPASRIVTQSTLPGFQQALQNRCVFDISAAKKQLGYSPEFDVEKGIREYVKTLEGYRSTSA